MISVLVTCYVTSLALRVVINVSYKWLVEPEWTFKTLFEVFASAVSTTYLLLCWSALYFGIKYYENSQKQREAALRSAALAQEAQLKMLRYQLNPHFLFNTLNAISTLILDNQEPHGEPCRHAAVGVPALYTRSGPDEEGHPAPGDGGARSLHEYRTPALRRPAGSWNTPWKSPRSTRWCPSLLLQPLIENAVKYAISPREEGGSIRIEGRTRGAMLEITVIDDGPGLRDGNALIEGRGVGLRNTRERLNVLYGEQNRFAVLNSHPGMRIEIGLPLRDSGAHDGARPGTTDST